MGLYTADGARKYLTAGEREAFLRAAERADREARTLCMTCTRRRQNPSLKRPACPVAPE